MQRLFIVTYLCYAYCALAVLRYAHNSYTHQRETAARRARIEARREARILDAQILAQDDAPYDEARWEFDNLCTFPWLPEDDLDQRTDWVKYANANSATVYGYPSGGGVYVLENVLGVELEFLGFDRFAPKVLRPAKTDPDRIAKDDAHCDRMRLLGARWWELLSKYFDTSGSHTTNYTKVCWPAGGGAWAIHTEGRGQDWNSSLGRLHNAYNMDERCRVIEQSGGKFFADPKDCPWLDLPESFGQSSFIPGSYL